MSYYAEVEYEVPPMRAIWRKHFVSPWEWTEEAIREHIRETHPKWVIRGLTLNVPVDQVDTESLEQE